jgi:hypothetical protein
MSVALSRVDEMKTLYEQERVRNEENEIARVAQWEKDRKARLEIMNNDRASRMDSDSKAAMEVREAARVKRSKMEEESKALKLSLHSELETLEKAQNDARAVDMKLRGERELEEKRKSTLYEKLKSMERRVSMSNNTSNNETK